MKQNETMESIEHAIRRCIEATHRLKTYTGLPDPVCTCSTPPDYSVYCEAHGQIEHLGTISIPTDVEDEMYRRAGVARKP